MCNVDFGNLGYYHLHFKCVSNKVAATHKCLYPVWLKIHRYDFTLKADKSFQSTNRCASLPLGHITSRPSRGFGKPIAPEKQPWKALGPGNLRWRLFPSTKLRVGCPSVIWTLHCCEQNTQGIWKRMVLLRCQSVFSLFYQCIKGLFFGK